MSDTTNAVAREAAKLAVNEFIYGPALKQVVSSAVDDALQKLGFDTEHPADMRRDMVSLREWNEFWERLRDRGFGAAITWAVTGALAALAVGIGVLLGRH